jgi:hypothetical protein
MDRLRLVSPVGKRRDRAAAQQTHPVLRVAHLAARRRLEEPAGRPVRDPAVERHLREVVEAVADDQLCVACGEQERGDRVRRVLAVGVDDQHGVGAHRAGDPEADG